MSAGRETAFSERLSDSYFSEAPPLRDEDLQRLVQIWQFQTMEVVEPEQEPMADRREDVFHISEAQKSLESIQMELGQLPQSSDYAAARSLLLNQAALLSLDNEDVADHVHELALRELFESSVGLRVDETQQSLQSFSTFLPVIAHEVVLKTALDSQEALDITLEGLDIHADPLVRAAFVNHFIKYFPADRRNLMSELQLRRVSSTQTMLAELP